jgi:hypothetical protein
MGHLVPADRFLTRYLTNSGHILSIFKEGKGRGKFQIFCDDFHDFLAFAAINDQIHIKALKEPIYLQLIFFFKELAPIGRSYKFYI